MLEYVATRCPKKNDPAREVNLPVWSIWVNSLVNHGKPIIPLGNGVYAVVYTVCIRACTAYTNLRSGDALGMLSHPPGVQIWSAHFMVLFHGANALWQWILGQGSLVNGGKIYAKFYGFLPMKELPKSSESTSRF